MSTLTHDATVARPQDRVITAIDWGLLILRLILGVVFFAHGAQKVLGWFGGSGLAATVQRMAHMGIPAPLAYLASFTEFLGGLGLIFGVLSRLSALGIGIDMIVAILLVHLPHGFFAETMGFQYPLALFGMALMILLAGPGRLAIGDLEATLFRKR